MTLDKLTREAIASAVHKAVTEQMETYDELWLTARDLCERLPMFTVDWLARYGHKLPREHLTMISTTGDVREGRTYMYPLHRIKKMVAEGRFRHVMSDA